MSDLKIQGVVEMSAEGAERVLDRVGDKAVQMAAKTEKAAQKAGDAVDGIGAGASGSADQLTRAEGRMLASIKRVQTQFELAGKTASQTLEYKIDAKGLDAAKFEPALAKLRELESASLRAVAVAGSSLNSMGMSANATAAALRGVPAQFTDIITSLQGGQAPLTVFMQQGGQLKDMFGGAGNAAKALGGYVVGLVNPLTLAAGAAAALGMAYYQGSGEAQAFATSLIMSGNAAGTTAGQLMDMAKSVSSATGATRGAVAETLNEIAASGKVSADVLAQVGKAAVDMERAGGQAASATVKEFVALGEAPVDAILKLDSKYHFLTASVYEQIKALKDQGRETDAAKLAQTTYADALEGRIPGMVQNLGAVEKAWKSIVGGAKSAWDAMLNVGREGGLEEQLAKAKKYAENLARSGDSNTPEGQKSNTQAQQAVAAIEAQIKKQSGLTAAEGETNKAREAALKTAIESDKLRKKYLTNTAKLEKELAEIAKSSLTTDEKRNAVIMARKHYAEKPKEGTKNDATQQYAASLAAEKYFAAAQVKLIKARVAEGVESEESGIKEVLAAQINGYAKERALLTEQLSKTKDVGDKAKIGQQIASIGTDMQVAAAEYTAALAKIEKAREKYLQSQVEGADNAAYKIEQENVALRAQIDVLGMTDIQLGEYEAAKVRAAAAAEYLTASNLREAASSMEAAGSTSDAIHYYRALADAREAAGKALDQKALLESEKGLKKAAIDAAKESEKAWKSGWEETDKLARQSFSAWASDGRNAAEQIGKSLETALLGAIYEATLKPIAFQIYGTVTNALGIPGAAAGSSGLGSLSNLGSMGNSAYNYFTGDTGTLLEKGLGLFSSASTGAGITAGAGTAAYVGMGEAVGAGVVAGMEGAVGAGLTLSAGTGVGAATAATAGMGAVGATGAGVSGGLAAGGAATAGLAAVPVAGWVALAATAAYSIFGGKDAGPKYEGNYFGILDNAGGSKSQQYATWWSHGTGYSGDSADGQLAQMAPSLTSAINGLVTSLGGTAAGIGVNYGFNHDDSGGANDQISTVVSDSKGNIAYENSYSMDSGGYKDALALEMQRMTLGAIKAADGIKPIFKELVDGIDLTTASAETITKAISDLQGIVSLRTAFENLNLDADGLSMSLISASGGVSAMASSLEGYYSAYFTETERAQDLTDSLTKSFAAMGIAVPDSKEAFRSLVESLDLTTSSGQATFAGLMSVNQAFAQMTKATAALTADTKKLEIELLKAQGFTEPASILQRKIDTAGMTAAEVAIYDYNAALRDQISATNAATAAAQSQAEAAATAAQAQADAAAAAAQAQAEAAAAVASERSGLQAQLDTALGNTTAIRARELAALDASNRALQSQIWAIEDQKEAMASAFSALESAVSAQKTALQTATDSAKAGISAQLKIQLDANAAQITAAQTAADKIKSIASALANAVKAVVVDDPAYTWERLSQARSTIAGAQGATDLSSVPGLEDALGVAATDSRQFYSTFEAFARDQLTTAGIIDSLDSKAKAQLTWQESIVKALGDNSTALQAAADAQLAALDAQYKQQIADLDATLAQGQAQIDAVNGVNTSVLSVAAAMTNLSAAVSGAQAANAASIAMIASAASAKSSPQSAGSVSGPVADLDANQRSVNSMYGDEALRKTTDASIVKDYDALRAAGVNIHLLDFIKERTGQSVFNADTAANTRSFGLSAADQQAVYGIFQATDWGNGKEFTYSSFSDSLGSNYTNEQMVSALANALGKTEDEIKSKITPNGSHAGGLERVPYDGYIAELHKDETVVDASSTRAISRYFGGSASANSGAAELLAELKALREEVNLLRYEARATATATNKTAKSLEKFDIDGMPAERIAA